MKEKTGFRRILSWVIALSMILSMLPIQVFAADYDSAGDTYASDTNDPTQLPTPGSDGLVWEGPETSSICGKTAHTHTRNSCYERICGGISWTHFYHTDACYSDTLLCTLEEHQHSSSCYGYTWELINESGMQWREWWPLYWGYDRNSAVTNLNAVSAVRAGSEAISFTSTAVSAQTALSASTSDVGSALGNGITVTMTPGYYVHSYRFVCGNHTGCGVTAYDERVHIGNTSGDYTSELVIYPTTAEFDHWDAVGNLRSTSGGSGFYIPLDKPTGNSTYSESGSNTLYPFYLLLEVQEDEERYNVYYNWGELASGITAAAPETDYNLLRNASHTVKAPSAEALAEADALGYEFAGWKVQAEGYDASAVVNAGNLVTIYGSDINLIAQWEKKETFTVTYIYDGTVPETPPALPTDSNEYHKDDKVTVAGVVSASGYTFEGWKLNGSVVSEFDMPENDVTLVGTWAEDRTATNSLSYTVYYYKDAVRDDSLTEVVTGDVWVNDQQTLPWKEAELKKTIPGYEYLSSDPAPIPANVPGGAVIKLYYTGNDGDVEITKKVSKDGTALTPADKVKVGDVLNYTITVKNTGTMPTMTDVIIRDTPNGTGPIVFDAAANPGVTYDPNGHDYVDPTKTVDMFTIASLAKGAPVNITYTYEVLPTDAGTTLTNFAFWVDGGKTSGDETQVEVTPQHTITIEHYAEDDLVGRLTAERTLDEGTVWEIVPGATSPELNYEANLAIWGDDGKNYQFDEVATTDALSGTLTDDTTVKLYYAIDEIGGGTDGDEQDDIPDKYQCTVIYQAETGGKITDGSLTKEVVTIYDDSTPPEYAERGKAVTSGSKAEIVGNYTFAGWELAMSGDHAPAPAGNDVVLPSMTLEGAGGGETYVFTATFTHNALTMIKTARHSSAVVGDILLYEIHIHNTGETDLTNIEISDTVTYAEDGTPAAGTIEYPVNLGGQYPSTVEGVTFNNGIFTIAKLEAGHYVNIIYGYEVKAADEGKTLKNTVEIVNPPITEEGEGDDDNTTETPVYKQATVTYKVVNGNWNDDTFADVTKVFSLVGDKYILTAEDIPEVGGKPAIGYKEGSWDTEPTVGTEITGSATFTYTYAKKSPGGGGGGGGGTSRYTITYESNGGTEYDTETYASGTKVEIKKTPVKNGFDFVGWYLDAALTQHVSTVTMTKNYKVYAKWSEIVTEVPDELNDSDHFAYVIGYPDGKVRPQGNISRAEVATIFFRLLKEDIRNNNLTETNAYSDVENTAWYNAAVSTMTKLGIVEGRKADTFAPDANITRAEFATIAARFDDSEFEIKDNFTDVAGHWAENEIHEAAAHGWIRGYEDGSFAPDKPITRAEAMTLINRVLNRIPENTSDLLADMIEWPDNKDTNAWYYIAIQEATNSHDFELKDEVHEKWTQLRDIHDWTSYEK